MNAAVDQPRECVLDVSGMDCASCVASVTKAATQLPGVINADVNLARGRAVVRFDPAQVSPNDIANSITRAGYKSSPENASLSAVDAETQRHQKQRDHARLWGRRALLGLMLWFPVELLHWIMPLFNKHAHHQPGPTWMDWLAFITSTLAMILIAGGFYQSAWRALLRKTSNMDTLIAMGTTVAYGYSAIALTGKLLGWWQTLPALYFMEATGLLALISLGHYLEARARDQAGSAIRELLNLTPAVATRMGATLWETVPVAQIKHDDQLLLKPGDRVPVDGIVLSGKSEIDESMITGEPIPALRQQGDAVIAGTLNQTGRLTFRATHVGAETALAQIVKLVESAQSSKPPVQKLADKIAAIFVPVVLLIALATGIGWYLYGTYKPLPDVTKWAMIAKCVCSVLIIACPCALGLAVPAALMVGTGRGAKLGILIRDIDALQYAEQINTIVFDKTGTITMGKPSVTRIITAQNVSENQLLELTGAAEMFSEHPLAQSILQLAREKNLTIAEPDSFNYEPGLGVSAKIGARTIFVGNMDLMKQHNISLPPIETESRSVVHVGDDAGKWLGSLLIDDAIKPDSKQAIAALQQMGLKTILLTGDHEDAARRIAREVGIDDVRAGVKPGGKAGVITELRKTATVAMVGDGINDAPALAAAHLGIAIGSGSDIAKETGGIVLVRSSLTGITAALRLSKATMRKIRQNLFFAFLYNVLAIPLAAMGFLTPLIAAGAMAFSDVTVIGNALLLKRAKID